MYRKTSNKFKSNNNQKKDKLLLPKNRGKGNCKILLLSNCLKMKKFSKLMWYSQDIFSNLSRKSKNNLMEFQLSTMIKNRNNKNSHKFFVNLSSIFNDTVKLVNEHDSRNAMLELFNRKQTLQIQNGRHCVGHSDSTVVQWSLVQFWNKQLEFSTKINKRFKCLQTLINNWRRVERFQTLFRLKCSRQFWSLHILIETAQTR